MGQLPTATPEPDFPRPGSRNLLTQPIIISVLHTPPRTLQPQGLCTCRGAPAWSAPSQLLLLPPSQFGWHPGCATPPHPPASALQHVFCVAVTATRNTLGPGLFSIIICLPPVKARTWPLQSTAGSPVPGDSQGSIWLGSRHRSAHPTDHGT